MSVLRSLVLRSLVNRATNCQPGFQQVSETLANFSSAWDTKRDGSVPVIRKKVNSFSVSCSEIEGSRMLPDGRGCAQARGAPPIRITMPLFLSAEPVCRCSV
jgi:hypothetical protein